jgi:hypothetical protein
VPNVLDANGLTTATTDEISTDLIQALEGIYGTDINTDSESPDGQAIGIYSQADSDVLDLLTDIFNMFSVASAYGIGLQRLVALNGMTIKGGTYTTTPVNVTSNAAGTLPGLDQTALAPYQVRDANTVWTLISSYSFVGAGTQALVFQAASFGPITPLPNTITIQATPLTFVASVNNPTVVGAVIGQAEETDVALRTRQAASFSLAATGPADAVEGQLLNLPDVQKAIVIENRTNGTVAGTPAHSLWCIVVGGTPAEIAGAIYAKSSPCGLRGANSYVVTRPNGQPATMYWDTGLPQRLWAEFGIVPAVAGLTFNNVLLVQQLAAALLNYYNLGQIANIGDIVRAMYVIEPRAILVSAGVSVDGAAFVDQVGPTSPLYYFTLAAADINIT